MRLNAAPRGHCAVALTSPSSGLEDHLFAPILLVLEHVVAARRVRQWKAMGDDPGRVNLPAFDALEQRAHVALDVALSGLEGQRAVHPGAGWELVDEAAVHADDRDDASAAAGNDGLA